MLFITKKRFCGRDVGGGTKFSIRRCILFVNQNFDSRRVYNALSFFFCEKNKSFVFREELKSRNLRGGVIKLFVYKSILYDKREKRY